ncbi:5'-nucleotidase SurE [Planctomycetes bacterium CA13]|uniref:5'-nucleotidase n=1 Tax=Novipirellula herctigrandis TaxID=2527986 RepID=A0A5C5Z106_9BACT|nr:5'-nucleotidase SurE [Planctomycetes bacterium CA13]
MRILLTNDDGIEAPGLKALVDSVEYAFGGSADWIVVAPDRCRSECSHSVTNDRPLSLKEVRPNWFSIDGTPVDCVRAGLGVLACDADLVLSGVNAGANVGIDLLISGTFAAAREAVVSGVPALAMSHYRRPEIPRTWDHVPRWSKITLLEFVEAVVDRKSDTCLWNVNLPAIDPSGALPPRVRCSVDSTALTRSTLREASVIRFERDFHGRERIPDHDVDCCFGGKMTISELPVPTL